MLGGKSSYKHLLPPRDWKRMQPTESHTILNNNSSSDLGFMNINVNPSPTTSGRSY